MQAYRKLTLLRRAENSWRGGLRLPKAENRSLSVRRSRNQKPSKGGFRG
jgi:hypothetical protein